MKTAVRTTSAFMEELLYNSPLPAERKTKDVMRPVVLLVGRHPM